MRSRSPSVHRAASCGDPRWPTPTASEALGGIGGVGGGVARSSMSAVVIFQMSD